MIIHELFTEEDIRFFIDWAKPRLSAKRVFNNKLDSEKPSKSAHLTQKVDHSKDLSIFLNLMTRPHALSTKVSRRGCMSPTKEQIRSVSDWRG